MAPKPNAKKRDSLVEVQGWTNVGQASRPCTSPPAGQPPLPNPSINCKESAGMCTRLHLCSCDGSTAEAQLASGTAGHEPRPPARAAIQTPATLPALAPAPTVPSQESTAERRPRAVDPPTIAPACAAAERRHLGVWSACAALRVNALPRTLTCTSVF